MTRNIPISLAIGALCLAAVAQSAAAQSYVLHRGIYPDSTKVVTYTAIPYTDLDVASSAGARALLERIEGAADAVCGGAANKVTKAEKEDYADCRGIAIAVAVDKMRSPALTTLAAGRRTQLRAAR